MPDVAGIMLERALEADAADIANLYLASRADALPYLRRVHDDDAVRLWIRDGVLGHAETWVARRQAVTVGFMTLIRDDLDQLYLLPGHYRVGIGSRLLELAKRQSPARLQLYTFQRNARARAFYERHGFSIIGVSDGARNEEQEPDIHYEWVATRTALSRG